MKKLLIKFYNKMAFKWINKFFLGKIDFDKCVDKAAYYYGKSIGLEIDNLIEVKNIVSEEEKNDN
jgi:hypothetical protein